MKGVPEHLRSDNGPEFVAKDLQKWLAKTGAKTFLNGEIFYSMKELPVLAERWRVHYNTVRPHGWPLP